MSSCSALPFLSSSYCINLPFSIIIILCLTLFMIILWDRDEIDAPWPIKSEHGPFLPLHVHWDDHRRLAAGQTSGPTLPKECLRDSSLRENSWSQFERERERGRGREAEAETSVLCVVLCAHESVPLSASVFIHWRQFGHPPPPGTLSRQKKPYQSSSSSCVILMKYLECITGNVCGVFARV